MEIYCKLFFTTFNEIIELDLERLCYYFVILSYLNLYFMKKLYIFLIFVGFFFAKNFAQNLPIAVNDTIYYEYPDTLITHIASSLLTSNDTLGSGNIKIIDTISYQGTNQVSAVYYTGTSSFLRVKEINIELNPGFSGLDSITYYLTDNGVPTAIDTAIIYIYVKRKRYEIIDLNNIKARVDKESLFMDMANGIAAFEVPKGSGSYTILASNFWFAGFDINGQLKVCEETYAQDSINNSGPIGTSKEYSYQWDRVWKVSTVDIQNHISGNGTTEAILNWPAHGDIAKGQAYYLAPFVDVDSDNHYDASSGDYPLIKGQQAIYFIRNSDRALAGVVTSRGLEFHGMVYAYDCPEDSAINHTIFVDYTIYNRSSSMLTDCYFGQWVEFDMGNPFDDYVGCDVSRGTFYAFNGDNFDEDAYGVTGYGSSPPFQGVTFLKGIDHDDGIDNPLTTDIPTAIAQNGIPYAGLGTGFGDGIIDNEYYGLNHFMYYNTGTVVNGNGEPLNATDYYNYIRGRWLDGVGQAVWGGDGNPTYNSGAPSKYMFTGGSDPLFWSTGGIVSSPTYWSEVEAGNTPGDRRGIGSTGPFTLLAGEIAQMELAFVFGRDYNGTDNWSSLMVMQERVDSIRSYHANGFATTPCGGSIIGIKTEAVLSSVLTIFPNPFSNNFTINYEPISKTRVEVFSLMGIKIANQSIVQKQTILDLSNQPNGVYFVKVTDGSKILVKKVVKQ